MQKITSFLWFNDQAEEAVTFYTSVFKDAKVNGLNKGPDGKVFTGSFELFGQEFIVLNGGPMYTFTEAISFMVHCENQEEVDYYWDKLTEGGQESRCGWLKDRFGISWQIIPKQLQELIGGPDAEKSGRAMQAMMQMSKIDIAALQRAYDGE